MIKNAGHYFWYLDYLMFKNSKTKHLGGGGSGGLFIILHMRKRKCEKYFFIQPTLSKIVILYTDNFLHIMCYLSYFCPTTNEAKRRLSHRGGIFHFLKKMFKLIKNC